MPRTTFVEIRHPDVAGTGRVPEGTVAHWRTRGWEPVDQPDSPAEPDEAPLEGGSPEDDPTTLHTSEED